MSMRKLFLTVALALVVVVGLVPTTTLATGLEQAVRRLGNTFIVTSVSHAALDVDQRGSGSILNLSDGGADEYTFDQSSATFVNQLNLSDDLTIGNGTPTVTQDGEDAYIEGTLEVDGATRLDGAATLTSNVTQAVGNASGIENVGNLPTWQSAAITTATDGALWTVGSGEVWNVARVICNVTTNFDCTGDDCALKIGDGNDDDGFLVLADAELQAADTEGTGFAAGWQGLVAATVGAYIDPEQSFIYAAADTIDIDIRDVSAGTNPTAGAATCYINYTRLQ